MSLKAVFPCPSWTGRWLGALMILEYPKSRYSIISRRYPGELEIVVFLMAERIKAPHRKAGIFQRQRQRWQVRLGTKKGNSFLMEGKWGHPISLQSLLLLSQLYFMNNENINIDHVQFAPKDCID